MPDDPVPDKVSDVRRFGALGTTEQGESGTLFRVDYLKGSGAIGFYHPDWVAVQKTSVSDVNWIIETKGRVWEGTLEKDAAMEDWCSKVSDQTKTSWRYVRVNQAIFGDGKKFSDFQNLIETINGKTKVGLFG